MAKENFLKTKKTTAILGIISFVSGIFFLNKNITGNVILNNYNSFSAFSLIGALLILGSFILAIYSIKK